MRNCADLRKDLLDDLKNEEVMLTSDMTPSAANSLWLQNSFWKKFQDEIGEDADAKCLELFKRSNSACNDFVLDPQSVQDDEVIGEVKSLWMDVIGNGPDSHFLLSDILDNIGVGPGANVGARADNFYTKLFDSPLTGTSERLYRLYRYAIMANPTWLSAENSREERYGHQVVVGNRLSYAPKTSEISRSICTEPTLNMLLQKGIGFVLEKRLKEMFHIDLSRQPALNRRMAQRGSFDGSFGTIDLSSASDSISLKMLQEILPADILAWLMLARSPNVVFPDGVVSELYMVSSMGNGFTFPLESLLFSTIVVACYRVLGVKPISGDRGPANWAVFGDDIIVRKDCYDFVVRALKLFGFTVNDQKSFNTGHFRESCGGDFFRGADIRGVYCKSLLTSADVYSTINRLIRWSARSGVLLTKTLFRLKGWVEDRPIPFHDGDAEGIKYPYPPIGLSRDYHHQAHVYYALEKVSKKALLPKSEGLSSRLRHFGSAREIGYNPDGLLVAFVGGYIQSGCVSVKSDRDTFKVRKRTTSRWTDWTGSSGLRTRLEQLSYQQYACYIERPLVAQSLSAEHDWEFVFDLYR